MIGSSVTINPGAGPIPRSVLCKDAWKAIRNFRRDLKLTSPSITIERNPQSDSGGRYGFTLTRGIRSCDVEMPGIPVDHVRYVKDENQNIWNFPRLYVDGSSWVWCYAVEMALDGLEDHDGSIERRRDRAEKIADRDLEKTPYCPCGYSRSIREHDDDPFFEVVCLGCGKS